MSNVKTGFDGLPTPKTLDQAIGHTLVGPLHELRERSHAVLKDFLAQKFSVAYLKAESVPGALPILEELFHALTVRTNQPAENSPAKRD